MSDRQRPANVYSDTLKTLFARVGQPPKYPTPWSGMNNTIFGFFEKELTIIGARPGQGKTMALLQMAWELAMKNMEVLFLSFEMPPEALFLRLASLSTGIDNRKIRFAELSPFDQEKLEGFEAMYHDVPLTMVGCESRKETIDTYIGVAKPEIIFVDYLQYMHRDRRESEYEAVSRNSKMLSDMAKERHIPIVCAAQINRQIKVNPELRPTMEDLKGSGSIEQDADVIWLLHWPWKYMDRAKDPQRAEEKKHEYYIEIAKNRHGSVNTVELYYDAKHFKLLDPHAPHA